MTDVELLDQFSELVVMLLDMKGCHTTVTADGRLLLGTNLLFGDVRLSRGKNSLNQVDTAVFVNRVRIFYRVLERSDRNDYCDVKEVRKLMPRLKMLSVLDRLADV